METRFLGIQQPQISQLQQARPLQLQPRLVRLHLLPQLSLQLPPQRNLQLLLQRLRLLQPLNHLPPLPHQGPSLRKQEPGQL